MKKVQAGGVDGLPVGVVGVPDDWSVTRESRLSLANAPAGEFEGDGFLPNVLVRVDDPSASDELPTSTLVLSDRVVTDASGDVRRLRCVVIEMLGESLMQLVVTVRTPLGLMSVNCTSSEAQWPRLAETFDDVAESASFDLGSAVAP